MIFFPHNISWGKFLQPLGLQICISHNKRFEVSPTELQAKFNWRDITKMNKSGDCYPSAIAKTKLCFKLVDINIEDISQSE